jgi:hypothetical protein
MTRSGQTIRLNSPKGSVEFNTDKSLKISSVRNHLTGKELSLGAGPEIRVAIDLALERIGITGWKFKISDTSIEQSPDADAGYCMGYHQPAFRDENWTGQLSPAMAAGSDKDHYLWFRTHLFIPGDYEGSPMELVLGGLEAFDFRHMRVFLNGQLVGTRQVDDFWHPPGRFDLGPESKNSAFVQMGQDNVIALQLWEPVLRTPALEELDREGNYKLPYSIIYPVQFEQYLVIGRDKKWLDFEVKDISHSSEKDQVTFILKEGRENLEATVQYSFDPQLNSFTKTTHIFNTGETDIRIMDVNLGAYSTGADVSSGGQGFPAYLDQEVSLALRHPSGWVTGQNGKVNMFQFPGKRIEPGKKLKCMDWMLTLCPQGEARRVFRQNILRQSRRVQREHDKAYSVITPYGSWPIEPGAFLGNEISEDIILDNLKKVRVGCRDSNCCFDLYFISFWHDVWGDMKRPDPARFPDGFKNMNQVLQEAGMKVGIWLSSSRSLWVNGANPVVKHCRIQDFAYQPPADTSELFGNDFLCRATDPFKAMYQDAFLHHIRENKAGALCFDDLAAVCYNKNHKHLPGLYSTEAIHNSVIDFLKTLDEADSETLLMLYWGYRSPWWLLHGDTLFEPGVAVECASPSKNPMPYFRDSITQGLDQTKWLGRDIPSLGKDSLGVWLSDWPWNSSVGTDRWQPALIMDLCRGSLLAQIWCDEDWLDPGQRQQVADFMNLLKANQKCFMNSRFIGSPWSGDCYGYCCSDGAKAFVALNNCTWDPVSEILQLNTEWNLPDEKQWDIYRWYPSPSRLLPEEGSAFSSGARIDLNPFETVLLEIVEAGTAPSLNRSFKEEHTGDMNASKTERPALDINEISDHQELPGGHQGRILTSYRIKGRTKATGQLCITAEVKLDNGAVFAQKDMGLYSILSAKINGKDLSAAPVIKSRAYPSCWQVWRIPLDTASGDVEFVCVATFALQQDAEVKFSAYGINLDED